MDPLNTYLTETASLGLPDKALVAALSRIAVGELRLTLATGETLVLRGGLPGPVATWVHLSPDVARDMVASGPAALRPGFANNGWRTPDLGKLLFLFMLNPGMLPAPLPVPVAKRRWWQRPVPAALPEPLFSLAGWPDIDDHPGLFGHEGESLPLAQDHLASRIIAALSGKPGDHILDYGCGLGGLSRHLAKAGYVPVAATADTGTVPRLQDKLKGLPVQARIRIGDLTAVRGRFERIVVVARPGQPLPEPSVLFAQCKRMLKPGGKLVLVLMVLREGVTAHRQGMQALLDRPHLATLPELVATAQGCFLYPQCSFALGEGTARCFRLWREAFREGIPAAVDFHLAAMEAAHLAGCVETVVVVWGHQANPQTV